MKLILVGDVHISDVAPRSRIDDYCETVFLKLEEINSLAAELGASAILQCGDFFHVKTPSRVSHRLVQRAMDVLGDSVVPWFITPGNHDLPNGRLDQLHRQPLGVLYKSGVAKMPIPDYVIDGPISVQIHGVQFTYDMDKNDSTREVYYPLPDPDPHLVVTVSHGTVIHGTDGFFVDYTNPRMLDLDRVADVHFNGHLHFGFDDEIIEHEGRKLTFVNPGSITRGSLHEYNAVEQRVKVKILTVHGFRDYSLEDYYLKTAKPPSEVLAFDLKESLREKDSEISDYVLKLSNEVATMSSVSSYDDIIKTLFSLDVEQSVKEKAKEFVERAFEAT